MKKLFPLILLLSLAFFSCKNDDDIPPPDPDPLTPEEMIEGRWMGSTVYTFLNGDTLDERNIPQDSVYYYDFNANGSYIATYMPSGSTTSGLWNYQKGSPDSLMFVYGAWLRSLTEDRMVLEAEQQFGYSLQEVMLKVE